MAENVVISFQADTSGLQPAITLLEKLGQIDKATADKFRQETQSYQQQLTQRAASTKAAFDNLDRSIKSIKVDNSLAKALDQTAPLAKTTNSVQTLKQQVREATIEAQNLAQKYGDLDPRAVAAAQSAALLKDQLQDVNARIDALNPEAKFQAIVSLASGIAGGFTAAQGALGLLGIEGEDTQKALLKVEQALALTQGLNAVTELKDAFTNLKAVLGLTSAATAAQTAATTTLAGATVAEGVAAEGAAVANKAFAASLTATGIGAVLVVLGAIAAAFVKVSNDAKEATEQTERLKKLRAEGREIDLKNLEASEKLKVTTGEITEFEARRLSLQRAFQKENFELFRQQQTANRELQENENKLADLRARRAALPQFDRTEAQANIRQRINDEIREEEAKNQKLRELAQVANDNVSKANKTLQTELATIKAEEVNAAKKGNDEIVNDAKETAEEIKGIDFGIVDKRNFDNAASLINQYYKERELAAVNSATTVDEKEKALADNNKQRLQELIQAGQKFNQDTTQLQIELRNIELSEQDKKFKELERIFNDFLKTPAGRYLFPSLAGVKNVVDAPDDTAFRDNLFRQLELATEVSGNIIGLFNDQTQARIDSLNEQLAAQEEAIAAEEELNKSKYDKGLIGIKEFRDTEKKIEEERKKASEEARKREIELKRKQDVAARAQALFDIAVGTARNIVVEGGKNPALIPFFAALGATQAAAVLARPLPKYQKGTLSLQRGNNPTGTDTIPILANEGEAIIPTDKSRAYRPTLEALYHGKISPKELNAMVTYRLKEGKGSKPFTIDYDTLANKLGSEIAWRIKDGRVRVTNFGELASVLSTDNVFNRNR